MGEGAAWWVEQRYRAVLEVRSGSPVSEVAERYGVSRQAVYGWRARFDEAGVTALTDRCRRPHRSPTRTSGEVEAEVCNLRRRHPRWGEAVPAPQVSVVEPGRGCTALDDLGDAVAVQPACAGSSAVAVDAAPGGPSRMP